MSAEIAPQRGDGEAAKHGRRSARKTSRDRTKPFRIHIPVIIFATVMMIPFYWVVVFAFRAPGSRLLLPWPVTFDKFVDLLSTQQFHVYFVNSAIVAAGTVVLTVIMSLMGGYALARFPFRGKVLFVIALLCTQFIPGAMMLIPLYEIFQALQLLNTLHGLIVACTVFQLPLSVVLMAGFVRAIPFELEEQAMLDGCSRLRAFWSVVLPVLPPSLVAVGAFALINAWNNFLFALMFIARQDLFTVPVGLSYFIGEATIDVGSIAAGGLLAVLPVIIVFGYVQKYLIQGMTMGAMKG